MANVLRAVKVPPNSASLEEARQRVFDFFRTACRSIPTIMDVYNLNEIVAPSQLRSTVAAEIRKNSHITNPKVNLFFPRRFVFPHRLRVFTTFLLYYYYYLFFSIWEYSFWVFRGKTFAFVRRTLMNMSNSSDSIHGSFGCLGNS